MKVSGIIRFQTLTPEAVDHIRAFQCAHSSGYVFDYAPNQTSASIQWEDFSELAAVTRLTAEIATASHVDRLHTASAS